MTWVDRWSLRAFVLGLVVLVCVGWRGGAGDASELVGAIATATAPSYSEGGHHVLSQTLGGRLRAGAGAPATAEHDPAAATDEAIEGAATGLRLMGYSIAETAAGTAGVIIRNGDDDADLPIVADVALAAGESVTMWFGPDGIDCANGIFIERTSGTTRVTVHYKTE